MVKIYVGGEAIDVGKMSAAELIGYIERTVDALDSTGKMAERGQTVDPDEVRRVEQELGVLWSAFEGMKREKPGELLAVFEAKGQITRETALGKGERGRVAQTIAPAPGKVLQEFEARVGEHVRAVRGAQEDAVQRLRKRARKRREPFLRRLQFWRRK